MKYIVFTILVIIFINSSTKSFEEEIIITKKIILQENLQHAVDLQEVSFFSDSSFVASSHPSRYPQVIHYNKDGLQINVISKRGRGPFEFMRPTNVQVCNDQIYVWDHQLSKLMIFERNGEGIKESIIMENNSASMALDCKENIIAYFTRRSVPLNFVRIINYEEDIFIKDVGSQTIEHELMTTRVDFHFNMYMNYPNLYYGSPIRDEIVVYNILSDSEKNISLNDDDFYLGPNRYETRDQVNQDIRNAIRMPYIYSQFKGVYELTDFIVGITEVGLYNPENIGILTGNEYNYEEDNPRRLNLFVYDKNMNFIKKIKMNKEIHEEVGLKIVSSFGNSLVFYRAVSDADEVQHTLYFSKITM